MGTIMATKTSTTVTSEDAQKAIDRLRSKISEADRERVRTIREAIGVDIADATAEQLEHLARLGLVDAGRVEMVNAMRAPFAGVPSEEIQRELKKALAEVRAEMRAERENASKSA
jgi:hypothetical protein